MAVVVVVDLDPRVEQVDDPALDAGQPLRALVLVVERLLAYTRARKSSRRRSLELARARRRSARRPSGGVSCGAQVAASARSAPTKPRSSARAENGVTLADLDRAVERLVEVAEALVVRAVARLVDVEQRHDETRVRRRRARRGSSPGCIRRRSSAGRARPSDRAAGCRARQRSCSSRSRSRPGRAGRRAVPSRRRASATLSVGTREVSSTTSENVLRS